MKESTKRLIAAIFFVAFFFVAYKCSSQTIRIKRHEADTNIVTKFYTESMKFGNSDIDTIYVNVCADSIDVNKGDIIIFVYYPEGKISQSLKIGFFDGSIISLKSTKYEEGYSEFKLQEKDVIKLKSNEFDYIFFSGIANCQKIKNKRFFSDFINSL